MYSKVTASPANWLAVEVDSQVGRDSSPEARKQSALAQTSTSYADGIMVVQGLVVSLKSQLRLFSRQRKQAAQLIRARVSFARGCGELALELHPSANVCLSFESFSLS
jgi:hypothetical protein